MVTNITENNTLIAQFMGYEIMNRTINGWEPSIFNFHNSWDSLMLLVEKIENIKWLGNENLYTWSTNPFQFRIQGYDVKIVLDGVGDNSKVADTKHYDFYNVEWRGKSKIELVYLTCIAFINWYNENK